MSQIVQMQNPNGTNTEQQSTAFNISSLEFKPKAKEVSISFSFKRQNKQYEYVTYQYTQYKSIKGFCQLLRTINKSIGNTFTSDRDIIYEWIAVFRNQAYQGTIDENRSRLLGFFTHIRNSINYSSHQTEENISQNDLLFVNFYIVKSIHLLKREQAFNQYKSLMDECIAYLKSDEILVS